MSKKNERCPLQSECERKCKHVGHELDCDYYNCNAREELVIGDQEEIRRTREREQEERWYAENFGDDEENLGDEEPDGGGISDRVDEGSKLVMLPIGQLHPHPDNPRKALGDLTELADSIRANGVFQNLTVVRGHWASMEEYIRIAKSEGVPKDMAAASYEPKALWEDSGYTVIIGHRRRAASELAGLTHLPCVIVEMTPGEQITTMLLENMQRSDLTVYEQAQGFQMMIDMGDTPEGIAAKTGFSKTTVNRRLKMAELDQTTLQEVSCRQISLEDFDKLSRIRDISKRNDVLKSIGTNNFEQSVQSAIRKQEINRNVPIAKKLVRELKANKISRSETYGSAYTKVGQTISLWDWDGKSYPSPKKPDEKLYYTLEPEYGELKFFTKTPKAKPVRRPQAEIDKEKRINEAHDELKRMSELHYQLRKAFVDALAMGKNNTLAMLQGAVLACAGSAICYTSSDRDGVLKLLGMANGYEQDRGRKTVTAFDNADPKDYPKLIYARMGDREGLSYGTGYRSSFPEFRHCDELELVYTWLCWCGYEMSDDEIALRDGTHEVLHRGKEDMKL